MPRQARLDSPGTLHHVMIRGIEGRRIVDDDQDRSDFGLRVRPESGLIPARRCSPSRLLKPVGTRLPSFLAQAVKDVVGRPRLVRIASVVCKALLGNFELSLGDRNLAWIFRDTIPKRLQITDLLTLDRLPNPGGSGIAVCSMAGPRCR